MELREAHITFAVALFIMRSVATLPLMYKQAGIWLRVSPHMCKGTWKRVGVGFKYFSGSPGVATQCDQHCNHIRCKLGLWGCHVRALSTTSDFMLSHIIR